MTSHRRRLFAALAMVVVAGFPGKAAAQVATFGTIEVIAEDSAQGRLPGVTVTATAADTITRRTAVTDGQGVAVLEALAPSAQYVVTLTLSGFQSQARDAVLVRSGQTASLRVTLPTGNLEVAVEVSASSPIIDTTSASTGQDITLLLTESLPTGRSYQTYLQLVPGVMPDDQTARGNPAARGGMNYTDTGGDVGVSSDNVYYFDSINVTDPVSGTFGANLNTEIIQEQNVITGGIPAEYVGAAGLISNVITKSGSNQFHGSVNYFFQNSRLVAEDENGADQTFSTDDTAFTIGGPAFRDKAWFFGSYRFNERSDDVSSLDTDEFLRSVSNTQHQGFAKGSFAITQDDLASFTYLSDPTSITGRTLRDITNARDFGREQGGHRFAGNYTRVWGNTLLELGMNKHNGEVTNLSAIRDSRVDVLFRGDDDRTLADEQQGGYGRDLIDERDNLGFKATLQHIFGMHTLKGGFGFDEHENFRDTLYVGGSGLFNLGPQYSGISAADIASGDWSNLQFDVTTTADFTGFINGINGHPNRAAYYAAYDVNADGTITPDELGDTLTFTGQYDRDLQAATGPQLTSSRGMSLFLQDQVQFKRLSFNIGVRAERWEHFGTTGESIYTFDWALAPRLSATYDLRGDGRHRLSGYWGRYYDPVRNDMTNFAGTLTGSIIEEQVYALGEYVTYRTRGGATVQDAFFSPTTKTPYTDDLTVGYAVDLGNNMSLEATYFNRRTRDVLEDYDLTLYASDDAGYGGDITAPDSLWLGLDYFGYSEIPLSNYVIGTLAGGKRDFQGAEFVFRKRFSNNWQVLSSYTRQDGKGNTNSDADADFQGDVLFVDPRAPNQYATQPGLIRDILKGAGSYTFPFGLQLGATFNWNSGTVASRSFLTSSRHLPLRVPTAEAYEFGGVTARWLAADSVGSLTNPAWGTVDVRAQYLRPFGIANLEVFMDLFNIVNTQDSIRDQDLVAGEGGNAFGDPIVFVQPRRAFFGARVRF